MNFAMLTLPNNIQIIINKGLRICISIIGINVSRESLFEMLVGIAPPFLYLIYLINVSGYSS